MTSSTSPGAQLLAADSCGFCGAWREVCFDEWRLPAVDAAMMAKRYAGQTALIRGLPPGKKIVTVSVVHDAAIQPLEGEKRKIVNDNVAANAPYVKAAAIVLIATGFRAAVVRGVIATLTLVTGAKYPSKTENDLEKALDWVGTHLDPPCKGADVLAGYRALEELARTQGPR